MAAGHGSCTVQYSFLKSLKTIDSDDLDLICDWANPGTEMMSRPDSLRRDLLIQSTDDEHRGSPSHYRNNHYQVQKQPGTLVSS